MSTMYYILLICSVIFLLYTGINVLLTVKFVNSLSTLMKKKYYSLARYSTIIFFSSVGLLLFNILVPQYLFKSLILIISMFLNSFNISEMNVLKKYI